MIHSSPSEVFAELFSKSDKAGVRWMAGARIAPIHLIHRARFRIDTTVFRLPFGR